MKTATSFLKLKSVHLRMPIIKTKFIDWNTVMPNQTRNFTMHTYLVLLQLSSCVNGSPHTKQGHSSSSRELGMCYGANEPYYNRTAT